MPRVVYWNPRRKLGSGRVTARIHVGPRVNNFGDLLGPEIVARIARSRGLEERPELRRILTVGSILHLARPGDVVWGSGANVKEPAPIPRDLDVRAVRGPLTAARLREGGNRSSEVFGDPALLLPHLWTDEELGIVRGSGGTVLVPNLHDRHRFPPTALSPRGPALEKVRQIASADSVIASSLHGIVVAEAFGVPAVLVAASTEPAFKYEDYYAGTGRALPVAASDWRAALDTPPAPPLRGWDAAALLEAFPDDLWSTSAAQTP